MERSRSVLDGNTSSSAVILVILYSGVHCRFKAEVLLTFAVEEPQVPLDCLHLTTTASPSSGQNLNSFKAQELLL